MVVENRARKGTGDWKDEITTRRPRVEEEAALTVGAAAAGEGGWIGVTAAR